MDERERFEAGMKVRREVSATPSGCRLAKRNELPAKFQE